MAIDIIDLRNRVMGVHTGQLAPDAYSDDELREAIAQLRNDRRARSTAAPAGSTRATKTAAPKVTLSGGRAGGLLDMLNKSEES